LNSTKFFTNENENTLISKIEGVFKHKRIHFFDALVGYFRASGYFQIRPFIEKTAEIRILVGINIDELIHEAGSKGLLFNPNAEQAISDFLEETKRNIQEAKYNKQVEEGMLGLIQDVASRKVILRIHPDKNIHAKIYIFREEEKHSHGYGAVITGSSNLTDAGLSKNFEFNVELRDDTDIDFATETFGKLWLEAVELSPDFIDKVKKDTFLNDDFTPFEVYIKFLIEYFGNSVDFDPTSTSDLPKGYKKLNYQADAVNDGFNKIKKHGGFFLADVVGLGKTVVAALIAKKFYFSNGFPEHRSNTLIVTPPALEDIWRDTLEEFRLENYEIITNGSLHKIRNPEKYDLIIVDEAHKFRTDTADVYNSLQKICKTKTRNRFKDGTFANKKVILISATPLNNKPEDIANLVYLFQDSKDSTLSVNSIDPKDDSKITSSNNLQHFFRQQIDEYKRIKDEKNSVIIQNKVKKIYERIRLSVIEPLTVRRTRTDLKAHAFYQKDLIAQGIVFPDVQKPKKIFYKLNEGLNLLYDYTLVKLVHPTEGLTYNRYQALRDLKPPKKDIFKNAENISTQLASIMKTLLIKRLDSSFYAFKKSIDRFLKSTQAMLKMFENGRIYIAPKLGVSEYINDDREEELILLIEEKSITDPTVITCTPDDFIDSYLVGLRKDEKILQELLFAWNEVSGDPKFDEFLIYLNRELLLKPTNHEGKLVVFSESKETTDYLKEQLNAKGFNKILCVESKSRKELMPAIRENFDANIPLHQQKNDYSIIISTEVLAEGVNLHRSNVIVNYDTPWNATRLMQRIGRVNRIGSVADKIHIYNFFPTEKVDKDIDLEKKALMKLTAFHAALGEDSQIFSPDEEFETFGLFDKDLDEDRDEKLNYLFLLRKFKEESPELFKTIKNMPLRARVGRKNKVLKNTTLAFIRNKKRDAFVFLHPDGKHEELSFLEAVKIFEANASEKAIPLHSFHHEQVQMALNIFSDKVEAEKGKEIKVDVKQGPNEKKAISYLEGFLSLSFISKNDRVLILKAKDAIQIGRFQKLQREINALKKEAEKEKIKPVLLLEKLLKILNSYPLLKEDGDEIPKKKIEIRTNIIPEIIISESFNYIQ